MEKITGYGNFLYSNFGVSSSQRHKLYKRFGFRCIISPQYYSKSLYLPLALHGYALDNGAFIHHKKRTLFDDFAFLKMVKKWGKGADFIVIPDVVNNPIATKQLSYKWIPILKDLGLAKKLLFVWQDGMEYEELHQYICDGIGVFIGGSTKAKIEAIPKISRICNFFDSWCHVGRVNTQNRIQYCIDYSCCSFDGSGFARFPNTFTRIQNIENNRQMKLIETHKNTSLLVSPHERYEALNTTKEEIDDFWKKINEVNTNSACLPKRATKQERLLLGDTQC